MEQLRLEESVRQVLEKCAEQDDPSITRDLLNGLVNSNSQQSVDVLSILLRELWVFSLHRGDTAASFHTSFVPSDEQSPSTASPKNGSKDTPSNTAELNTSATKHTEKKSLIGTISLPRATEFDEEEEEPSASDVPSHSSASSEDEENDDEYTEELWKQALESEGAAHKDFFASLVKNVEGEHVGKTTNEENGDEENYEDDLSLDERIFVAISSSLALAEQTQFERNIQDGEEDAEIVLTSMMISEIAMNIAQQIGLDNVQAVRCAEDIEDCLCFLYGQPLDSENRNFLTQTIQKLMLDRSEHLQGGQWFDPADEEEDDAATFDPLESINELASPHDATPEKNSPSLGGGRMASYIVEDESDQLEKTSANKRAKAGSSSSSATAGAAAIVMDDSSSSSSDEKTGGVAEGNSKEERHVTISAPSSNHVHQTPARTPARSLVTPGLSTNSKRTRINYNQLNPDLPAWMIPKSPLDSIFRTGYGGIGQSQLSEVIALVEDEDSSSDDEDGHHQRLHETSMDQVSLAEEEGEEEEEVGGSDEDDDAIRIDDIPTDFGRELLQQSLLPQHHQHIVPRNVMTKRQTHEEQFEQLYQFEEREFVDDEAVPRPEDFPSTAFANGGHQLTSNPSLNAMIYESFKGYLSAMAGESKQHSLAHNSTDFPYDYDEATVGTSMDSEGYKRMMKLNRGRLSKSVKASSTGASPKQSPKKSPANSPKPRAGTSSSSNPNSPHRSHQLATKHKQPITKAVVQSKKHPVVVEDDGIEEIQKTDDNLMLESPNNSFTLPKKSDKEPVVKAKKVKKIKKKATTAIANKTSSSDGIVVNNEPAAPAAAAVATKKKKVQKVVRTSSTSSRLLEATEASKIRGDSKVNALLAGKKWKA